MRREERDPAWLADMLHAAREARAHVGEMTREEFLQVSTDLGGGTIPPPPQGDAGA